MVSSRVLALACLVSSVAAWNISSLKSIVTFGDSYTDENRLGYFISHNGQAPPVGWVAGESNSTASGGRTWARFAASSANANLYDYAVSGAVCSNNITPRIFSTIKAPFPAVLQYEIPAFIADSHYQANSSSKPFLDIPTSQTVYAIWIGTNDLGNDAFLTDSQLPNKTVVDYVECVYQAMDQLYKNGGRNFILMNVAPLNLLPQYALPSQGGRAATQYFKNKGSNLTEISDRMAETVAAVNEIFKYRTAYAVQLEGRYNGAQVALFDTNSLLTAAYYDPQTYFGSAVNVTGFANVCPPAGGTCVKASDPQDYMWYDELHPSERTDSVIAKYFLEVVHGSSKFATYYPTQPTHRHS